VVDELKAGVILVMNQVIKVAGDEIVQNGYFVPFA